MKFPRSAQFFMVSVFSAALGYGLALPRKGTEEAVGGGKGAEGGPGGHPRRSRGTSSPEASENLLSPGIRDLLGSGSFSDTSVRRMTVRVLEETDPVRRSAAISLILDSMTPANASAIRQAFLDSTIDTGRRNDGEWFLMVRKFGETLGEAAFSQIKNNPGEAALALEGWAMADADGALAHLRAMDRSDPAYSGSCSALLTGIAKTNPEKCIELVMADPTLPMNAETLVRSAVQAAGMDGMAQMLQKSLDHAGPDVAENPSFVAMFDVLANDMMHQNWTAGHSDKMLPWLEQQKGQPFLTNQLVAHAAQDVALQGKMSYALDWLDRMDDGAVNPGLGRSGIRSAVMKEPSLLADLDEPTFGRVVAQFPVDSPELKFLANAIEPLKPSYASRLRGAAP